LDWGKRISKSFKKQIILEKYLKERKWLFCVCQQNFDFGFHLAQYPFSKKDTSQNDDFEKARKH